jgi:hypothetical protein
MRSISARPNSGLRTTKSTGGSAVTAVRDELLLIGLLTTFVGMIYVDAYYSSFAVKYQLLSLPSSFIVYQGIMAVVTQPWIIGLYVLAFALVHVIEIAVERGNVNERFRTALVLVFAPILLIVAYFVAISAGHRRATRDMDSTASTLPRVNRMVVDKIGTFTRDDNLRLFLGTSDQIMVFVPQTDPNSIPIIKHFLKGDIHELETTR